MNCDDLEEFLRAIDLTVERLQGGDGLQYTVIRELVIPVGGLKGTSCDIAILRPGGDPYVMPSAIHTRPVLVEMGTHTTQGSGIGHDWQYWSRRYDYVPTPKGIWTHVVTVLGEVV